MARHSRFSPERVLIRKQAEEIVTWIRDHGPVTMADIIQEWKLQGKELAPHVLHRALQKSSFITHVGFTSERDGKRHLWAFVP